MSSPIVIKEFESLYRQGDKSAPNGAKFLTDDAFNNLMAFCHSDNFADSDKIFKVIVRGSETILRAQNYVGTIETSDNTVIEILPKIHDVQGNEEDISTSRAIFLKMLAEVGDDNFLSSQDLDVQTSRDFPLLEIYIKNYLKEVENIIRTGINRNYVRVQRNERFLKGKILWAQHLKKNLVDKSKFFVEHENYEENIAQNRLIVTTLLKLQKISTQYRNKNKTRELLEYLVDIPPSKNLKGDLAIAKNADRMMDKYRKAMAWSEKILIGDGFTVFSGDCVNQAVLFPAEVLFERFVAKQFSDYAHKYPYGKISVEAQRNQWHLVDYNEREMFNMKPDIFVQSEFSSNPFRLAQSVIIDTKWKLLDTDGIRRNFGISMDDMYQLYAYGKKCEYNYSKDENNKYTHGEPKLVLIYPCSPHFHSSIKEDFVYESNSKGTLRLRVEAFDLTGNYYDQITAILERTFKEVILIACYRNSDHLDWIKKTKTYNMLASMYYGNDSEAYILGRVKYRPTKLVLYDISDPKEYRTFNIISSEPKIINRLDMINKLDFPSGLDDYVPINNDSAYLLYDLGDEVAGDFNPNTDIYELTNHKLSTPSYSDSFFKLGAPIFLETS